MVATSTTSAHPAIGMGCPTGAAVGELGPVAVRGREQLRGAVLGGRVQPEAPSRQVEVPAVLVQPALAQVDDLLTFQQRMDDRGPLLGARVRAS